MKYRRVDQHLCRFVHHKYQVGWRRIDSWPRGERPATNCFTDDRPIFYRIPTTKSCVWGHILQGLLHRHVLSVNIDCFSGIG